MNKKVVLSVLSTAVVASMAASAFAAPKDGLYIGGSVNKYYSTDVLLNMNATAKAAYANEVKSITDFNNLVFVDFAGKGASIQEILDEGLTKAKSEALVKEDFASSYAVATETGSTDGSYDARADVDGTTTGDLKVESVSAINSKQIEVKFGKAVDAASVIEGDDTLVDSVFTFTRIPADGGSADVVADNAIAELSQDGKTLTITADAATFFDGTYGIDIAKDAVKDADGNKMAAYKSTFSVADATRPVKTEVKYIGYEKARIYFSEPLASHGTVSYSDPAVTTTAHTDNDNFIEVDMSAGGVVANTDITVTIVGAKDYKGNLVSPNPLTLTVKKEKSDVVKPVVSDVTAVNNTTFTVTLSEKLAAAPTIKVGGTTVVNGTNATVTANAAGTVYTVEMNASQVTAPATSALKTIEVSSFSDLSGNPGVTFSKVVEFKVEAPAYVSSKVEKINGKEHLVLTFSKNVNAQDVKDLDGTLVKDFVESTVKVISDTTTNNSAPSAGEYNAHVELYKPVSGKSSSVQIDLSNLPAGAYKVTAEAGFVQDTAGNASVAIPNISFTRTSDVDVNKPALVNTYDTNGIQVDDNNTITVKFDRKLEATSALTEANYNIEGVTVADAIFTKNDSTEAIVKLTLAEGSVSVTGDRLVTISNVKSADNVAMDSVTTTEALKENVKPTFTAALVATDVIKLTFSEAVADSTASAGALTGVIDKADFGIYVGGTKLGSSDVTGVYTTAAAGTALAAKDGAEEVYIKLANPITDLTKTIEVEVDSASTVRDAVKSGANLLPADVVGNKVTAGKVTVQQ